MLRMMRLRSSSRCSMKPMDDSSCLSSNCRWGSLCLPSEPLLDRRLAALLEQSLLWAGAGSGVGWSVTASTGDDSWAADIAMAGAAGAPESAGMDRGIFGCSCGNHRRLGRTQGEVLCVKSHPGGLHQSLVGAVNFGNCRLYRWRNSVWVNEEVCCASGSAEQGRHRLQLFQSRTELST